MQVRSLVVLALLSIAPASWAESPAKAAYDRGTAAYKRGDFSAAAAEYAHADELAPNDIALEAAIDAAIKADDPVLGAELLDRARSRKLDRTAQKAAQHFSGRVGQVRIVCTDCTASIDDHAIAPNIPRWVRVGRHSVVIVKDGSVETLSIDVAPDETTDVSPKPSPPQPPAPKPEPPTATPVVRETPPVTRTPPSRGGISPAFFFVGLAATAGLGVASIALGVDTASQHDAFVRAGCPGSTSAECVNKAASGSNEQTIANVLIGATAAAGVTTTVLLFFVRWKSPPAPAAAVLPNGAWIGVRSCF